MLYVLNHYSTPSEVKWKRLISASEFVCVVGDVGRKTCSRGVEYAQLGQKRLVKGTAMKTQAVMECLVFDRSGIACR